MHSSRRIWQHVDNVKEKRRLDGDNMKLGLLGNSFEWCLLRFIIQYSGINGVPDGNWQFDGNMDSLEYVFDYSKWWDKLNIFSILHKSDEYK